MRRIIHVVRQLFLRLMPLSKRFDSIYRKEHWSGGGKETRSGAGSTLSATREIRKAIPEMLVQVGARSVLDVGCGDFNWMRKVALPCKYHGVDIASSVIADNQSKYS